MRQLPGRAALVLAAGLLCCCGPSGIPELDSLALRDREILEQAIGLELYRLWVSESDEQRKPDPAWKESFHGYPVIGKTRLAAAERRELLGSLYQAIREYGGDAALCFFPRHGIRARHEGQVVDLLICFQCRWSQVHRATTDGSNAYDVNHSRTAAPVFDRFLDSAGIANPYRR